MLLVANNPPLLHLYLLCFFFYFRLFPNGFFFPLLSLLFLREGNCIGSWATCFFTSSEVLFSFFFPIHVSEYCCHVCMEHTTNCVQSNGVWFVNKNKCIHSLITLVLFLWFIFHPSCSSYLFFFNGTIFFMTHSIYIKMRIKIRNHRRVECL